MTSLSSRCVPYGLFSLTTSMPEPRNPPDRMRLVKQHLAALFLPKYAQDRFDQPSSASASRTSPSADEDADADYMSCTHRVALLLPPQNPDAIHRIGCGDS
eukprot:CAMPEP_0178549172 /NCGR_PEP_ID=MMETSP0697-20121206/5590_1 /TAXON_ID=265572 /ORGANISM="Extubocellulus spinifer, Strain CCMP396" /LENGTH=100 /DNA_ID=CAMNT_0020181901 /DNA_START=187 /DNA_END=489 /DNA_ORIENTATION=+